jgi:hypothetical protein
MNLEDYLLSDDEWVREQAEILLKIKEMHDDKLITYSEYQTLIENVIDTNEVVEGSADMQLRSNFLKFADALLKVV